MIVIVFTVLNPLVIPFALIYFSAAAGMWQQYFYLKAELNPHLAVHKNQLMRVYAKWYDQKGTVLFIRIFRYSLDGFLFAEVCNVWSRLWLSAF